MRTCLRLVLAVLLLVGMPAWAAPVAGSLSRQQAAEALGRLKPLVARCSERAEACDRQAAGEDLRLEGGATLRLEWLRAALERAREVAPPKRAERMRMAEARLDEDAAALVRVDAPAALATVPEAESQAAAILARREFRNVVENSWWSRWLARVQEWIGNLFNRAAQALPRPRWLAPLLEWGFLAGAAAAVLLWAWRQNRQQRIQVVTGAEPVAVWQRESEDWAARAAREAEARQWREAVHSLFWSAIVLLEGSRLWRRNAARTPREYVALLEPGSVRRSALGGLTRILERIWYGLRAAEERDYLEARALLDELRVARPELRAPRAGLQGARVGG